MHFTTSLILFSVVIAVAAAVAGVRYEGSDTTANWPEEGMTYEAYEAMQRSLQTGEPMPTGMELDPDEAMSEEYPPENVTPAGRYRDYDPSEYSHGGMIPPHTGKPGAAPVGVPGSSGGYVGSEGEIYEPETEEPEVPMKRGATRDGCVRGGCSAQWCLNPDDPRLNLASTCEWRPEYACYMAADCARQANGQCGWSETPELKSCLENPPGRPSFD